MNPQSLQLPPFERARLVARTLTEAPGFQQFIVGVIVLNAITLGLETTPLATGPLSALLVAIDRAALTIFSVEIALKLLAQGRRFFSSGWNLFDLAIVSLSLAPATGGLSVLRALRVLRIARIFSAVPSLRIIVEALVGAIPAMSSIVLVLGLIFYLGAVLAVKLFGAQFPELFGTLPLAMLSLFQLMTLDGWNGDIVTPVLGVYPWSWLFFIPFIFVTAFAVLNLFIGVLMSNIEAQQEEREVARDETLHRMVIELGTELAEIRTLLRDSGRNASPHD
jgi:voltage-gated sodium channel